MYFPPEILSAILCSQSKIELKKARLVCKAFDAAAVPFLFDEIFIAARYADIEKAILLASRFGSFVKALIFCSEEFSSDVTLHDFKHQWADVNLATSYYTSYCKLREEQEQLLSEGEFFRYLCSTLILLSNLRKITLTSIHCIPKLSLFRQSYVDGCLRTFNPRSDTEYPALKSLKPTLDHECFASINGPKRSDPNSWPEVLRALHVSGNTNVKTIVTEGDDSWSGLVSSHFRMTSRQRFCVAKVLQNLTRLHIHLDGYLVNDVVNGELFPQRVIAQTLSAAINLESLMIEIIGNYVQWEEEEEDQDARTTFEMILGSCKMPKLVTLGLSRFTTTEAEMTTFLQDSQGIRHMSLDDVKIISGSWEDVFRNMKATLPLKSFESRGLHGGVTELFDASFGWKHETDRAIEKFLFGDGPNPFSNAALKDAEMENENLLLSEFLDEVWCREGFRCWHMTISLWAAELVGNHVPSGIEISSHVASRGKSIQSHALIAHMYTWTSHAHGFVGFLYS